MKHDISSWLNEFKQKNQRNLRVLHVGNVANNAYLNAKLLRKIGVDADVMARDDFYIMACPEWEEIYVTNYKGSDFFPRFLKRDIGIYKRPSWFVQGPIQLCGKYLIAKHNNRKWTCKIYQFLNNFSRHSYFSFFMIRLVTVLLTGRFTILWEKLNKKIQLKFKISKTKSESSKIFNNKPTKDKNFQILFREFRESFQNRVDVLSFEDIKEYTENVTLWKEIAECYDIIQFYGIDPIWAVISDIKPYIAFEHGTLRDFTFGDSGLHRINALSYRKADHVFITNGDCLAHAHSLGIKNYSGIAHPLELSSYDNERKNAIKFRNSIRSKVVLFCPMRHDWAIKGSEVHIRAVAGIDAKFNHSVKLILCAWGSDLPKSRELIKKLNIEDKIIWLKPLCRKKLIETMIAADVILDQMILPCFGGIAPQALAVGTPVIMSYKPETTEWLFPEPPPILSAFSVEEVISKTVLAMDPAWRDNFNKKAKNWINTYHHPDIIVEQHLQVYRKLLGPVDISTMLAINH